MNRRTRGFTLLEVLVVLSLLGVLLTLIAGAITGANRAMGKAERYSTRLDEVRSTQNFLRHVIGQALPLASGEPGVAQPAVFIGEPRSMRFYAPLMTTLGGGLYRYSVTLAAGQRLQVSLERLQDQRLLPAQEPQVLMHRDLQSTNFLRTPGGMALIDYQGMRAGPAAYDVASLLADPYVDRAAEVQLRLLTAYAEAGGEPIAESVYRAAAVQRLIQALGAYGRLGAQPGTRRFLQYILPALRQLQHWAPSGPLQNWAIGFYERQMVKNTLGPAA